MSNEIGAKLEELPKMGKLQLRALWLELFAKPAHPKLRRDLMIPVLAYRIQENAYGGLDSSSRKRLDRLAEAWKRDPKAQPQLDQRPKSGTKLLRQWQGQMHEVMVVDQGFEYRGHRHRSLSQIATLITGTRWSGPAFFGLKQPARKTRPTQ